MSKHLSEDEIEKLVRRADSLMEVGNCLEAGEILEEVLKLDPNNVEGNYLMGEVSCKKFDFSLAVEHLKKANLLMPNHPRILHLLGWAIFMKGDPDLGRGFLLLSLEKFPDVQAYCDLAVLENQQGNSGKAMEYALKAKEIEPESEIVKEVITAINYFSQLRQQLSEKVH